MKAYGIRLRDLGSNCPCCNSSKTQKASARKRARREGKKFELQEKKA